MAFRDLLRKHPRLVMLGFGLGCALGLALVGAVGAELYLRAKEAEIKGAVTREVDPPSIDAPSIDAPPAVPEKPPEQKPVVESKPTPPATVQEVKPPEVKTDPNKVEPAKTEPAKTEPAKTEPAKIDAPKVELLKIEPGKPQMVAPKIEIKHDAGDLTPEKRKIYYDDPQFGYRHMANTRGTEVKKTGAKEIYRATYTSDEFGRRITPFAEGPAPEHAVMCIGCSFTFGLGVNDDQTMPWQFALNRPDLRVYNYGVAGYGPQHMLELFKTPVEKEIPQKKVAVVYTLIQEHLSRAVGTPGLVRWFAGPFPWYEMDESSGHPVRKGVFKDRKGQQPSNSGLKIIDAVNDYRGESLTMDDAKLMAALIDETRMEFEKKFESDGFYVLVYPNKQTNLTMEVVKILKEHGAKILDYRDILKGSKESWFITGDGHPSPALHARIAEQLAKDVNPPLGK